MPHGDGDAQPKSPAKTGRSEANNNSGTQRVDDTQIVRRRRPSVQFEPSKGAVQTKQRTEQIRADRTGLQVGATAQQDYCSGLYGLG